MRFPIKSIKDEFNYRKKLLFDPLFALKHKTLARDLGLLKPLNLSSPITSSQTQPTHNSVPNLSINDPLKQQVDAEMKFASYQFSQGMEIEKNNVPPQTAAEQQNLMYTQDQLQNSNNLYREPWNPAPFRDPYKGPMQPLYPGPMGPLY